MLFSQRRNAQANLAAIGFRSVRGAFVPLAISPRQARKLLLEERQELLARARHEEEHASHEPVRIGRVAARARASKSSWRSVRPGSTGMTSTPGAQTRLAQRPHRGHAQVRPRSARLEQARQARTRRGNADADAKPRSCRDALQDVHVADNLIRFRSDRNG